MNAPLHLLRREIEPTITMQSLDDAVLRDALHHLQYHPATVHASDSRKAEKLQKTLQELDITPFNAESVNAYKGSVMYGNLRQKISLSATFLALSIYATAAISGWFFFAIVASTFSLCAPFVFCGRWESEALNVTKQVVPMFALDTAIAIKRKLPEAIFGVDYYRTFREVQDMRRELAKDPFLWVAYGKEVVYVEVWDEPKFDAERKA